MEKFKSPKLLITDHYDEQIRQVDIYIEELLEKYKGNDLLPTSFSIFSDSFSDCFSDCFSEGFSDDDSDEEYSYSDSSDNKINKIGGFIDPYRSEYNYYQNNLLQLDVIPGTTRIKDYLEIVRSKAIEELKKAEQHNLDNYELNKDLYKYDRNSLTDEKVEEMRQNLFKDKFAFVVKIVESNKSLLKFNTILTDFYLDEKDLDFLKRYKHCCDINIQIRDILDEKSFVVNLFKDYVIGLTHNYQNGTEIISIKKASLFEVNQANIIYSILNNVNLPSNSLNDFSFIKSLKLEVSIISRNEPFNEIRDLSGLKQLEYLQIKNMRINANSFYGLNKLIKLELIECFTSEEILCFDSLNSLQFLRIVDIYFSIELKSLENLNVLIIEGMEIIDYIINVSESLTYLQINSLNVYINNPEKLFSRSFLHNLIFLKMTSSLLPHLEEQWFRGMKLLKELILNGNCLEILDFCRFNCLKNLEKLDLASNCIRKLDEGVFSKLNRLKWLNISNNPIFELGSNVFRGLKNLETLFLDKINLRKKFIRIEKDTFSGLTNLKRLSLNENHLEYIDPEAFYHTPKLIELNMRSNKLKLEENIFANLKHLKKIELRESDLEHINKDKLEYIKKLEIDYSI